MANWEKRMAMTGSEKLPMADVELTAKRAALVADFEKAVRRHAFWEVNDNGQNEGRRLWWQVECDRLRTLLLSLVT